MAFANQIDPALLQQLLSGQGIQGWGVGYQGANDTNPNESASGPGTKYLYDTGSSQDRYGVYDQNGQFQEDRSKESSSAQLMRFLAGAGAMYGAGSLLNGGLLGMGGGVPSSISGITPSAFTPAGPGSLGLGNAALGAPSSITGLTLESLAPVGSGAIGLGNAAIGPGSIGSSLATAGGAGGAASTAASGIGSLGNLGTIAGALAGAAGSKDQQQTADQKSTTTQKSTSTRDPYAPAKPFIDQMIGQGQTLANQYAQNPFSDAQKTAYGNYSGLLNAINGGASGLLGGANANASGANQFDRSNPRKSLTGSTFDLSQFAPGLLSMFGGK